MSAKGRKGEWISQRIMLALSRGPLTSGELKTRLRQRVSHALQKLRISGKIALFDGRWHLVREGDDE